MRRLPGLGILWLLIGLAPANLQAQFRPLMGPILPASLAESSDPLPIRRVFVPLERVSAELERAGAQKLIHLTRAEFDNRVRAARVAQEATRERPRLVEAHYQASLVESALVGKADWRLTHAGMFPGIFPMRLNLALSQVSLDGAPAILGDFEPRSPGLLIESPGQHLFAFDWSVRGEVGPNDLRFELRVPPCVLTSFELDLPAGRSLSAQREQCLVTGPFPGATAGRERWVLEVLNRARIQLIVRTPNRQDRGKPLLVTSIEERQNLSLEQVECVHDFSIDVSRGAIRELDLSCSPGLQPVGVTWRNIDLEDWLVLPEAPGHQECRLHIRLPQVLQNGTATLRIRALAAGPLNQVWHSPELRLQNALVLSEKLTVQISPELELTDWNSGQFNLTKTLTDATGCYLLQMQSGPLDATLNSKNQAGRPQALPRLQTAQATGHIQIWWEIGVSGERLTARARIEPRGSSLFRLQCRIPTGWRVDRAELQPTGLLADWSVLESDNTSSLIVIHLTDAIEASKAVSVLLNLSRLPQPTTGGDQAFAVPWINFPQALSQVYSLGVSVASQLRVKSAPAPIYWQRPDAQGSFPETGQPGPNAAPPLWDKHSLWGLAHFHAAPSAGQLVVEGLVPRVKVRALCRIDLSLEQTRAGIRLELEPVAGTPQTLTVEFSAPVPESWRWFGADGKPVEASSVPLWESLCLPGLSAGPLERMNVLASVLARPHVLRFTLPQPLTERRVIETPPAARPAGLNWQVPLPLQAGDIPVTGEVELRGVARVRATVETRGFMENTGQTESADHPYLSHLLYEKGPISLTIHAPNSIAHSDEIARVDNVALTTFVESSGLIREQLTFRLRQAGANTFPLLIPDDALVTSVHINGRWIAVPPGNIDSEGQTLNLPAPADWAGLAIEIVWERTTPGWRLWSEVQAKAPRFPVQTPPCRRVWSLAPGLAPANLQNLEPLPGFAAPANSWGIEAWLAARWTANRDRTEVQHLIAEADVQIRGTSNETAAATLGARLRVLSAELAKGQLGLVVDATALRASGLDPNSLPVEPKQAVGTPTSRSRLVLSAPFLQSFGLQLLSTTPVPLLTTPRAKFLTGAGESSPTTEKALLQAARLGRDATGRFENAAVWLTDTASEVTLPFLRDDQTRPFPNWPRWQHQSAGDDDTLLVVRQEYLGWAGYLLLVALGLFAWRIHQRRASLFVLGVAVFVTLLALSLLLPLHLFAAIGGPCTSGFVICVLLLILQRTPVRTAPAALAQIPIALAAIALLAVLPGQAAAPAEFTVLLLSEDGGKKVGVLAPVELLESLNTMVERGRQPLAHPVLLEARYLATAVEGSVEFDADFLVYCPGKGPVDFLLPLGSAELRSARCDLEPALPRAAPAGQTGYLFRLEGAGRHRLQLRFVVTTTAQGLERDCRIAVPETVCTQLDFRAPVGSQQLQATQARGSQFVTTNAGGVRLLADMGRLPLAGRLPLMQLHWRIAALREERPVLEVKETYVWDLQNTQRLLGVLRYKAVHGAETELLIDVPAEWEIRRVETAPLPGSIANHLRDWSIAPGPQGSRLRLEFQTPLTTSVQVFVELISRKPATSQAALALPTPVGVVSTEGLLAYHLGRQVASLAESLGFTGVDLKDFMTQWQSAGVEDPGALGRAFTFRRSAGAPLSMRLALKTPTQFDVSREITWRVGPRELACEAAFHLDGRDQDLTLVEWDLPPELQMEEVLGAEVRMWSFTNQHVQVWLRPGTNKCTLTWRAWARNIIAVGAATNIPVTHLAQAAELETNIWVEAEPGWAVTVGKLNNLHSVPAAPGALSLTTDQSRYSGEFILHEAPPNRAAKPVEIPASTEVRLAPKPRGVSLILEEQAAILRLGVGWEHRADYFFLAGVGQASICPPGGARFTTALLDGQELALPDPTCIPLRFEGPLGLRQLRIYWRWSGEQEPIDRPDLSKPRLENVVLAPGTEGNGLWEIIAPPAMAVQAAEPSTHPLNPPYRLVRRALASLSAAKFLAPSDKILSREIESGNQHNIDAASAWLAQAPSLQEQRRAPSDLANRLRQLEFDNRLLAQKIQSAEPRVPPDQKAARPTTDKGKELSAKREFAVRGSNEQGISSCWEASSENEKPRVVVTPTNTGSVWYWLVWCVGVAVGGGMLFLVSPWASEKHLSAFGPELAALLGASAGFVAGSWLLVLISVTICSTWRLTLLVLAATARAKASEPANLQG